VAPGGKELWTAAGSRPFSPASRERRPMGQRDLFEIAGMLGVTLIGTLGTFVLHEGRRPNDQGRSCGALRVQRADRPRSLAR
jgi:hypothetical protein